MTSLRPFHATDVFSFNPTNLDPLTETYDLNFYFQYLARWPHLFTVAYQAPLIDSSSSTNISTNKPPTPPISGYLMSKLESSPTYYLHSPHYLPFHAHITALTISPSCRRLGLARTLSRSVEEKGDEYDAWFVDLYVRRGNRIAQELYRGLGYSVYRRVKGYYSDDVSGGKGDDGGGEDAYDMRKPLRRDVKRKHVRENGETFEVTPDDVW